VVQELEEMMADDDAPLPSERDYHDQVARYETTFAWLAERGIEPAPALRRGFARLLARGPFAPDTVSRET